MQVKKIPHTQTGYLNRLMLDYLADGEKSKPFYKTRVSVSNLLRSATPGAFQHVNRSALVNILSEQYKGIDIGDVTKTNIGLLQSDNTYCIVTAHQLNIFTGPLYVIYKAVSTIAACRELQFNAPDKNFVPVFCLGSEDHDFAEINHFNLFGKTYRWEADVAGACGRMPTAGLSAIIESLAELFKGNAAMDALLHTFRDAYAQSHTLSQATRIILNALFGSYGLVIVDSDDAGFKSEVAGVIEDELLHHNSYRQVAATNRRLLEHFKEQAHAREINLFYVDDGVRERIEYDAETERYVVLNTDLQFSREAIVHMLQAHPERFSPNVILRPLFQQKVLPALAYVGGGGELSYWLQLKGVFDHYRIPFPALMLRNSVLLVDKNTQKKIQKLNLELSDFFEPVDALIKKYIIEHSGGDTTLEQEKIAVAKLFETLRIKVIATDSTLEKAVMAEMQNTINGLQKLEAKLIRSQKQQSETAVNQIRAVCEKLFPTGIPQERYDNLLSRYAASGQDFIRMLCDTLNPFSPGLTVLLED